MLKTLKFVQFIQIIILKSKQLRVL